jgi:hypothetical protein
MATLQERRLGYHSRACLEPGTSGFSTLRINHYAARGISSARAAHDTAGAGGGRASVCPPHTDRPRRPLADHAPLEVRVMCALPMEAHVCSISHTAHPARNTLRAVFRVVFAYSESYSRIPSRIRVFRVVFAYSESYSHYTAGGVRLEAGA